MEQWQRDHIRKNLPQLLKDTTCEPLFLELLNAEGVIGQSDIEILASLRSEYEKSARFYKLIQTRTDAYQALTNALRETSQTGPADLLEKANAGKPQTNSQVPTASSVVPLSPSPRGGGGGLTVPTVNILPATPPQPTAPIAMGNPSWDSAGTAPPPPGQDSVDFLNNIQPLSISVIRPQGRMAFPDDQYGLREESKGYALVLNITEFSNDKMNRAGASKDTTYMDQLWNALGYKVTVHEGFFTFLQVKSILETFVSQFKQDCSAQSCVVFFGSHGSFSKIESSDHEPIDLYRDLIYKFDSSQCKHLKGKSKIFIIQACQRFQTDSVPDRTQVDQMLQTPIDDTIVCFGTIPGYVANRDVYLGTWYTYCLTKVFMEEAHKTHLLGLLKKTQETMRNINAHAPQGQLSAYMDLGIKTLYFNMYP